MHALSGRRRLEAGATGRGGGAQVKGGRVVHVVCTRASAGVLPQLLDMSPRFLVQGRPQALRLYGRNLDPAADVVAARGAGRDLPAATEWAAPDAGGGRRGARLLLAPLAQAGVVQVEVRRGAFLSGITPAVALPAAHAAAAPQLEGFVTSASRAPRPAPPCSLPNMRLHHGGRTAGLPSGNR